MKNFYLLLALVVLFFACNREDKRIYSYPVKLSSGTYISTSKVRLFSKNGEVTDQSLIDHFIRIHGIEMLFKNGNSTKLDRPDTVVFLSKDSASIRPRSLDQPYCLGTPGYGHIILPTCYYDQSGNRIDCDSTAYKKSIAYKKYYIQRSFASIVFIPKDTGLIEASYDPAVAFSLYKYKPLYIGHKPRGNHYSGIYYDLVYGKYATGNEERLEFPLLIYAISTRDGSNSSFSSNLFINNIFSEEIIKTLVTGDTLAIQTYTAIYQ